MPRLMPHLSASFRRRAAHLALAATLSLVGTAALAQEQLIMPYACSAGGGRVTLTPSREEAYRIYGERQERPFTMCSPINPNVCRTWLLHRFELDCGGTRVDWLSVVEAASEQTTGRAWVEDGRMHMRMNQYWGRDVGPDDPCPRWRRRGRIDDDCADRGFRRPRGVVEMPPGFAPAFGLPVRFAQLDPPATPADAHAGSSFPGKTAPAKSARAEPPREVAAKELPAKDPPAKAPQVAGSTPGTPTAAPKTASRPVTTTPADTPAETIAPVQIKPKRTEPIREAAAEPVTPFGNVTVVPKIINRPATSAGAEQSVTGQGPAAKPTTPSTAKPSEPVQPKVVEARPTPDPAGPEAAKRSDGADAPGGHSTLSAYAPSSTAQAIVGFAGLIAAALALFVWTRRREQLSLAAAGAREFGTVTLDGRSRRGSQARAGTALAGPRPAPAGVTVTTPRAPPLPQTAATAASFAADGQIPRTREEACRVLGASPEAGEAAIKKIVEGLRQSWHPDLATSEADRQLREQRTTQINVAWDIVAGKRPSS